MQISMRLPMFLDLARSYWQQMLLYRWHMASPVIARHTTFAVTTTLFRHQG